MKTQCKGITLVWLVISIVILSIIATITIQGINGEKIVDKANEAKEKVEILHIEEEIRAALLKLQNIEEIVEDKAEWIKNELPGSIVQESTNRIIISYKGVSALLNIDYKIQNFLKNDDEMLGITIEEEIQAALLKLYNVQETVEDKAQWLREELKTTVAEAEDRIIISYKGYKIVVDNTYSIQEIFTMNEWDQTATQEEVFIWGSDDPLSADYGTVTGYQEAAKELTTLKYPSRCTKIMDCYSNGGSKGYVANIEKVEIPSTVVAFGDYAFGTSTSHQVFDNLKEVIIEKGVIRLGNSIFCNAKNLENVLLPDGIKSIPSLAFKSCTSLAKINIPNSVESIGDYAFRECTGLTNIIIPDSVTNIGYMAFIKCTSIESIVIPKSVDTMAMSVFSGWESTQIINIMLTKDEIPSTWNRYWSNGSAASIVYGYTGE